MRSRFLSVAKVALKQERSPAALERLERLNQQISNGGSNIYVEFKKKNTGIIILNTFSNPIYQSVKSHWHHNCFLMINY
jgi:hypothetical protein